MDTVPQMESLHFCVCILGFLNTSLALLSACWTSPALHMPPTATKTPDTYFYFLAEGSIGAILQLALVVNVIDHSRGNDLGLETFLLGHIIQTEPPASTEKKLIGVRRDFLCLQSLIQQQLLPL